MRNNLLFVGTMLMATAPAAAQDHEASLPGWLAGCWVLTRGNLTIEEQWMAPRAGTMLGMSRTTRGDTVTGFESTMITVDDGTVAYTANPSGQARTVFRMTDLSDRAVVFAAPEHDFPQRIGYERIGADSLRAWIDGTVDGTTRSVEFAYRRAACATPPSSP